MAEEITGLSVSSCVVHIKIYENNKKTGKYVDLGLIPPKHIQKMTHQLRADGKANELNLTLVHMFDPYEKTDSDLDHLEYIPMALNKGWSFIELSYGYAMSNGTLDLAGPFDMMVTSLTESFQLNGIVYNLKAVSAIAVTDQVDGAENAVSGSNGALANSAKSYNWIADPENRVKHYSTFDFSALANLPVIGGLFNSSELKGNQIKITDIAKCILSGYNGQEGKVGYNVKIYQESDIVPSENQVNYVSGTGAQGDVAAQMVEGINDITKSLNQVNMSDLNFLTMILNFAVASAGHITKVVDPNARDSTMVYYVYYTRFTASLNDHTKEAHVYPTLKVYSDPATGQIVSQEPFTSEELEKFKQKAGIEKASTEIKSVPDRTFYWGGSKGWEEQKDDKSITVSDVISFDMQFDAIASMLSTRAALGEKGESSYGEITDNGTVSQSSLVTADDFSGSGYPDYPGSMQWAKNLDAYSKIAQRLPVTGTLKTMGDTDDLEVMSQFKIAVIVNGNTSVVSGIYRVVSKTDEISSGGMFTSSYILTKIADDNKGYVFSEQYDLSTETAAQ